MVLSAFPFLTADEFDAACQTLADQGCVSASDGCWASIRAMIEWTRLTLAAAIDQNTTSALKITRCMAVQRDAHPGDGPEFREETQLLDDEDPEVLVRTDLQAKLQIDYDIVLSPTYQVPVLYFTLRWHNCQGPIGLEAVYQYVVPDQLRDQLKSAGVMGAISFGYHPVSGAPAFYVHPCNTAHAMAQIADAETVSPGTYLIIWLGLVGHGVNLHVPRELISASRTSPS